MPQCCDAELLQVLFRQARKDRLVYLVLAECRLILPEAKAPQPDHNVHDMSQSGVAAIMVPPKPGVQSGTVRPSTMKRKHLPATASASQVLWRLSRCCERAKADAAPALPLQSINLARHDP